MDIQAVRGTYGHWFVDAGDNDATGSSYERCLRCGATYELSADLEQHSDGAYGRYHASNGDDPVPCSNDTDRVHGYPGERVCENDNGRDCNPDGQCRHTEPDCNCVMCH